jgi:hypothetical protein
MAIAKASSVLCTKYYNGCVECHANAAQSMMHQHNYVKQWDCGHAMLKHIMQAVNGLIQFKIVLLCTNE